MVTIAIVVNKQSLNTSAPSATAQFDHHLSLLTSRSDSQRRESLSYLTSAISGSQKLPQPVSLLLPKLLPLTLDASNGYVQLLRNISCTFQLRHVAQSVPEFENKC